MMDSRRGARGARFGAVLLNALLLGAITVLSGAAVAACGGKGTSYQTPTQPPSVARSATVTTSGTSTGATTTVTVQNFAFTPQNVTISVGSSVTWTFPSTVAHNVTADDSSFASGTLSGGQTYVRTFDKAGSYPYHCAIHPNMTGTVTVR
jgi:plastocyanin